MDKNLIISHWKFKRNKFFCFARSSVAAKGNAIMLMTDENSFSLLTASKIKCLLPGSGIVWCNRCILAASFSSPLLVTHFSLHLIPFLFVFSCPPILSLSSSSSWRYLREHLRTPFRRVYSFSFTPFASHQL